MKLEKLFEVMDEIASKARPGKPLAEVIRELRDTRR